MTDDPAAAARPFHRVVTAAIFSPQAKSNMNNMNGLPDREPSSARLI
jgi:hypothetical protein